MRVEFFDEFANGLLTFPFVSAVIARLYGTLGYTTGRICNFVCFFVAVTRHQLLGAASKQVGAFKCINNKYVAGECFVISSVLLAACLSLNGPFLFFDGMLAIL